MSKIYQIITDKIIRAMEKGVIPWKKPWGFSGHGMPKNLESKKEYTGFNPILLNLTALDSGYKSDYWVTYKQAQRLGGQVKKGEKSTQVIFWKMLKTEDPETGKEKEIPCLRYYSVFNTEQCEGLKTPEKPKRKKTKVQKIRACEKIVKAFKDCPPVKHEGSKACYWPIADLVQMPNREAFIGSEEYYSTLFHELGHATGHASRLNRDLGGNFGTHKYSKEELVAEFTASFLCGVAGILPKTEENSAAYIKSWLAKFKEDNRVLIQAAAKAQKAADYIQGKKELEEVREDNTNAAA